MASEKHLGHLVVAHRGRHPTRAAASRPSDEGADDPRVRAVVEIEEQFANDFAQVLGGHRRQSGVDITSRGLAWFVPRAAHGEGPSSVPAAIGWGPVD
jgi:hypothetical protein